MPTVVVGIRHIGVFESALGDINRGICKQKITSKFVNKKNSYCNGVIRRCSVGGDC